MILAVVLAVLAGLLLFIVWLVSGPAPEGKSTSSAEGQTDAISEMEPKPARKLTPDELARELVDRWGLSVGASPLWNASEEHGLDVQKVDEAIDRIREERSIERRTKSVPDEEILDLRSITHRRNKVRGLSHWITFTERDKFRADNYLLIREPNNPHDKHALAVYSKNRKVGYVPASIASALSPILDSTPHSAFRIGGEGVRTNDSSALWLRLPRLPELRKFLKEQNI